MLGLGLLGLAVLLLIPGVASAKKPQPPPPPTPADTGTIYYGQGGLLHRMAPDGTGSSALPASIAYWAEPSAALHGGRWFLQVQVLPGETYPAPAGVTRVPRLELFAVHESGAPAVQLTDGRIDASTYIEPNHLGGAITETSCVARWTAGDAIVSYTALRTTYDSDGNRTVQDGGLYVLAIAPDALSSHTPTPMNGAPLFSMTRNPAGTKVLAQSYDWRPDGSAVVYPDHHAAPEALGVWIAEASDGFSDPTRLMMEGTGLRWSPDGSRILFFADAGIGSIAEDGTDLRLLVADPADTRQTSIRVYWPTWSPSGTHIAYAYFKYTVRKNRYEYEVIRATEDGNDRTGLDAGSLPRWRP
jgi:hypothetical protein